MLASAIAISCLLASANSYPALRSGDCSAADDYIDQVLANVAQMILDQGLDPAELPGDKISFSQDIGFITIHGSARYDQGHFNGLSTIHRTGGTELCVGDNIGINANIGLRDARAGYHVAAELQGLEVGASAEVHFASLDIYFEASMPLDQSSGLQLTRFEITNIGHIDVSVSGLGPLDWILGKLVGAIADTVKGWIIPLIEGPIKDILQDIIDDMMPPIPAKIHF
eukprot:TRINITY_DN1437_c0_g1_i1.p1 TRINITY_DN1437_c0_g1~~TRINITY_DN1437_c0_g1_i1.p1  ORF type:complete len:226 (+),score=81.76 TRINITY_DN1437_c0_g1_i1:143-820(+)